MKDLPTDIGTFSTIIENNYLYVDKTKYIYNMAKPGKKYFLSRPRRFGKSLLISTLKELYKGNKKLFKDLYIYDKWDWSKKFPVLHLDMSDLEYYSIDQLKLSLHELVDMFALRFSVNLNNKTLKLKFSELLMQIYSDYGQKVVVLIDEYDKAILDNIADLDLAEEIRKELNNFYGVLKSSDKLLEFVFLIGVSKFSKTSIFSGLNNLTDLTLNQNFSCICGYTQEDLETIFKDYLVNFSKDNNISCDELLVLIKDWYDGYSWDGSNRLYNPYSILSLFTKGEFGNFWFESGTPSFLMDFVRNNKSTNILFDKNMSFSGDFPTFILDKLDFKTLLLQTGYLTIREKYAKPGRLTNYKLAIPNKEVNDSLYNSIIEEFSDDDSLDVFQLANMFLKAIKSCDNKNLQIVFDNLICSVPSILFGKVKKDMRESNFHIWFLSWFKLMGFFVIGETPTSDGYMDAVLKKDNLIIVCEIKYSLDKDLNNLAQNAISQIYNNKYYSPYTDCDVVLLGVAFGDREVKSIIEPLKQ
ncbi:MAG: AAA family ATPase [Methanobrevibacter sp. CfCl-M3]